METDPFGYRRTTKASLAICRIRKWCDELDDASELQAVYCMQGREKGKELSMSSMNVAGKDIFGSYFSEIVVIVKGRNCMKAMRAFL